MRQHVFSLSLAVASTNYNHTKNVRKNLALLHFKLKPQLNETDTIRTRTSLDTRYDA